MSIGTADKVGLYRLRLEIGTGAPGAPTFNFEGLVSAPTGAITGQVEITQITAPPFPDFKVQVSGRRTQLDPPQVAFLHGQYLVSFPPPAIGEYIAHLEILIVFRDNTWNGTADITYSGGHLTNVPVKSIPT